MIKHKAIIKRVVMRRRGQVTIPKKIREEDTLREDDVFIAIHSPNGDIVLRKENTQQKENLFDVLASIPSFDWEAAWSDVKEERAREHR